MVLILGIYCAGVQNVVMKKRKIDEVEKANIRNIFFWIMITLVICLCIYLLLYIKQEGYSCIKSPLTYGVSNLREGTTCTCSSPLTQGILLVTKDNMTLISNSVYLPSDNNLSTNK